MQWMGERGEVYHDTLTDISATHGAARASCDERHPMFSGPGDQELQVGHVFWTRDPSGNDAVDSGAFGIRCSSPGVSAEDAAECRWRQHRPKLIMFTIYG